MEHLLSPAMQSFACLVFQSERLPKRALGLSCEENTTVGWRLYRSASVRRPMPKQWDCAFSVRMTLQQHSDALLWAAERFAQELARDEGSFSQSSPVDAMLDSEC